MVNVLSILKNRGGPIFEAIMVVFLFATAVYLLEGDSISNHLDSAVLGDNVKWSTEKFFQKGFLQFEPEDVLSIYKRRTMIESELAPASCASGAGVKNFCAFLGVNNGGNFGCCTGNVTLPSNFSQLCPPLYNTDGTEDASSADGAAVQKCRRQFLRYWCTRSCFSNCDFWKDMATTCSICPNVVAILPTATNSSWTVTTCPAVPTDANPPSILKFQFTDGTTAKTTTISSLNLVPNGVVCEVNNVMIPDLARVKMSDVNNGFAQQIGVKSGDWAYLNGTGTGGAKSWVAILSFFLNPLALPILDETKSTINYAISMNLEVFTPGQSQLTSSPIVWTVSASNLLSLMPVILVTWEPCEASDENGESTLRATSRTTGITNFNCYCGKSCGITGVFGRKLQIDYLYITSPSFYLSLDLDITVSFILGKASRYFRFAAVVLLRILCSFDFVGDYGYEGLGTVHWGNSVKFITIRGLGLTRLAGPTVLIFANIIHSGVLQCSSGNVTISNGSNITLSSSSSVFSIMGTASVLFLGRLHGNGKCRFHGGKILLKAVFSVPLIIGGSAVDNRLAGLTTGATMCGQYSAGAVTLNTGFELDVDTSCQIDAAASAAYTAYSNYIGSSLNVPSGASLMFTQVSSTSRPLYVNGDLTWSTATDSYLEITYASAIPASGVSVVLFKTTSTTCDSTKIGKVNLYSSTGALASVTPSYTFAKGSDGFCTLTLIVPATTSGTTTTVYTSAGTYSLLLSQSCPAFTVTDAQNIIKNFAQYPLASFTNWKTTCTTISAAKLHILDDSTLLSFQCLSTSSVAAADSFCQGFVNDANTAGSSLNTALKVINSTNKGSSSSSNLGLLGLLGLIALPILIVIGIVWYKSTKKPEPVDYDYNEDAGVDKEVVFPPQQPMSATPYSGATPYTTPVAQPYPARV